MPSIYQKLNVICGKPNIRQKALYYVNPSLRKIKGIQNISIS